MDWQPCLGMVGYWTICILVPSWSGEYHIFPGAAQLPYMWVLGVGMAFLLVFTVGTQLYTSVLSMHMHREMFFHMPVVTVDP
jgi:hypothetical protein